MYQPTASPFPSPGRDRADRAARAEPRLPVVVSVHLPKTAGTSFGAALRRAYGEAYLEDYGDLPMQHAPWKRQWRALRAAIRGADVLPEPVRCVHGHFLAAKYRFLARRQKVCYITWLRDPVERIASHYHFWRRDYAGDDPAQPLRNRVLREEWSFERFALGPEMRDVYRRYLWRFDPRRFDFIGITEHYDATSSACRAGTWPAASRPRRRW